MKLAVIVLFGCVCCTYSLFWKQFVSSTAREDCKWSSWTRTGLCYQMSGPTRLRFKYGRKLTRQHIKERNGGKKCSGSFVKFEECSDNAYIAATFLKAISSAIPSVGGGGIGSVSGGFGAGGGGGSSGGVVSGFAAGFSVARPPNLMNVLVRRPYTRDISNCALRTFAGTNGNNRMAGRSCGQQRMKREAVRGSRTKRGLATTKNRDVLFLIDESGSVGPDNFKKFLRFAKAIANSWCGSIRIKKSQTRVGVLTFDSLRHHRIDFDEFFSRSTLIREIGKIKYNSWSDGSTCLVDALQYSKSDMMTTPRGARANTSETQKMVILMTDGCANCDNKVKSSLADIGRTFASEGIPIFTYLVAKDPSSCYDIMTGLVECFEQVQAETWGAVDEMSLELENSQECMDAWRYGRITC